MNDLVLKSSWHDPGRRRLEAVKAAQERDVARLLDLLNHYLSYLGRKKARTSEKTRKAYELGARVWIDYCWPEGQDSPDPHLLRATVDDLNHFIATLQQTKRRNTERLLTPSTIQTYMAGVRALYRALIWAGALDTNPALDAHAPSDPRPRHERRPAVDTDVFKEICDGLYSLSQDSDMDTADEAKRDLLLIRLFGDAGLRLSDAVNLNVADLDLRGGEVFIRSGKGGKSATVPMTRRLLEAVFAWLGVRDAYAEPGEEAVFVNFGLKVNKRYLGRRLSLHTIERIVERHLRDAGLPLRVRGPHSLRHTAGTRMYRLTGDLYKVAEFLRHSNINTSAIYAKMDRASLKENVLRLDE